MRIILIQPPIRDFYQTHDRMEPLGLEYIAASLQIARHQVSIINACTPGGQTAPSSPPLPIPAEISYMKNHYPPDDLSPFRLFTHFQHFGLSIDNIVRLVFQSQPDLVGISANFTPYEAESLECARAIKNKLPNVPIVLGGHHATIQSHELMQHPFVDFIIRGEGEISMALFAHALQQSMECLTNIPGLLYRNASGRIVENLMAPPIDPLESLPAPIRSPQFTHMILTSRGCPRHCRFCSIAHVMGATLRFRTIPDILNEIEETIRNGVRHIDFEDDNMNWDRSRMLELMDALAVRYRSATGESGAGVLGCCSNLKPQSYSKHQTPISEPIRFSARNGLVAEKLDAQILQRMADAGFERVNLAVVSGNPSVQKQLERNQPVSLFEDTVHLARAAGLKVTAYLILGLPTDTLDEMIRNILWLAKLPVEIGPSIFYPVPGTPLFDLCVQRNYINPNNKITFRSSAYPVETENFTRNDLVTLMRICRLLNFIKNNEPLTSVSMQTCLLIAQSMHLQPVVPKSSSSIQNPKFKIQNSPDPQLAASSRLNRQTIGAYLIHRFLETGRLFGLRYRKRRKSPYIYEEIDYCASDRVTKPVLQVLQGLTEL